MKASLRAFLDGLIDYAGLFPPANLDMPEAVETYARHLDSEHAWMVGRFICPAAHLDEFAEAAEAVLKRFRPVKVAALASPMRDAASMLRVAPADAERVKRFEKAGWGRVDVLEAHLPDALIDGDPSQIPLALDRYEGALRFGGMRLDRIFYEVSRTKARSWDDRVERLALACSRGRHRAFKIRCGGLTHDAFPSVHEVADAVETCVRLNVPYKATAGLHHMLRHRDEELGVVRHGFLNVFAAGMLAGKIDRNRLEWLIDDRDIEHFGFTDEHFTWGGFQVSAGAVAKARHSSALSYGSCDIDEPLEDLRTAGLL